MQTITLFSKQENCSVSVNRIWKILTVLQCTVVMTCCIFYIINRYYQIKALYLNIYILSSYLYVLCGCNITLFTSYKVRQKMDATVLNLKTSGMMKPRAMSNGSRISTTNQSDGTIRDEAGLPTIPKMKPRTINTALPIAAFSPTDETHETPKTPQSRNAYSVAHKLHPDIFSLDDVPKKKPKLVYSHSKSNHHPYQAIIVNEARSKINIVIITTIIIILFLSLDDRVQSNPFLSSFLFLCLCS